MTKDETRKILMTIDASYPNFAVKNPAQTVDAWHFILEDYDYSTISLALKMYITTSNSAFAPSVSELIGLTRKPAELTQMEEVTAWRQVRKAIGRSIYYAQEEYEKLAPEVQKVVGDPAQLTEWAKLQSSEIDTVIQSNFKKRFETMQKRQAEIDSMPAEIRQLIESKITKKVVDKQSKEE